MNDFLVFPQIILCWVFIWDSHRMKAMMLIYEPLLELTVCLHFTLLCAASLSSNCLLVWRLLKQIHEWGCECCSKLLQFDGGPAHYFSGQWGWGLYVALHTSITPPPIVPLAHSFVPSSILELQTSIFAFSFFFEGGERDRITVCSKLLDTFVLISTNLYTLLNIYNRFMELCIPKLFVHILLRLDCSACDSNDTPQEAIMPADPPSKLSIYMLQNLCQGPKGGNGSWEGTYWLNKFFLTLVDTADQLQG